MPGKKLYFGTNLKMYKGIRETVSYLCELEQLTADMDPENVQLFVIPSYTSLPDAIRSLRHKQILLGAQNMCWEEDVYKRQVFYPYLFPAAAHTPAAPCDSPS